jgi:hypothetical protein
MDLCSGLAVVLPAPPVGTGALLPFPPRLGEHDAHVYEEVLSSDAQRLADLAGRRVI